MIVYRLCKEKYKTDLSGKGAEKAGGRWNSKGTAVVYTCNSRALCTIEIAVHTPLGNIPLDYHILKIEIPDNKSIIYQLKKSELPENWKSLPHPNSTQIIGDNFIRENKYLLIKVPSAIVKGDYNYLINPYHKDFSKVKILETELFEFDERLFVK
ncbi:RES family NAD+ phosphorylase [Abyssalbus ytuae]|uniref:RES family NAD+ phosphorylase n=1 Tax=Abyssalbus ytuae TaxID=2926907 RepID=A0A9E6ZNC1_9FLAO|nr:RES family NAD+ phosphorylase [Abyssalbus ytuae]UOB17525.1 RES family NAD+ phosphorylase [Abyssalbus ytuae]